MAVSASHFRAKEAGQLSLFGGNSAASEDIPLPVVRDEISQNEILGWERELIGLYVSDHPLNAVMGFVNILTSMKTTREEREEMVELIEINSQRLLRLINDMIDLSRIESNNLEIKYTNVEVNDFLSSITSAAAWEKETAGIRDVILTPVKGEARRHVYQALDELRLSQIFSNLISNAMKFTEKGEIQYGYNVKQHSDGYGITYFVRDTGIGIPVEKQQEIFKPFVQLWSEDMPKIEGAGLGLAICSRMTEIMKGRIWVESAQGKGSTFYFTFNTPVIIE